MLRKGPASVHFAVRLSPGASRNEIGQMETGADGRPVLRAKVTTVPEKGKANKALIKMLARELRIPAGQFSVASGATNRNKQIEISGDPDELCNLITRWIKDRSQ
ncbi:DUF167 family protein [Emcibacter sp.]|uniref:DUF167 family protein n=1 Tax=Emcibacter sp. TaxID=1979954 RepID=UPI003A9307AD